MPPRPKMRAFWVEPSLHWESWLSSTSYLAMPSTAPQERSGSGGSHPRFASLPALLRDRHHATGSVRGAAVQRGIPLLPHVDHDGAHPADPGVDPSDERNWLRALFRLRFLYLLDEEAPEVKEELRDEVFPLFEGLTEDAGATWSWTAITADSTVDNIRPIIPAGDAEYTALLWLRGTYTSYKLYDLDVVGLFSTRQPDRLDDFRVSSREAPRGKTGRPEPHRTNRCRSRTPEFRS